MNNPPGGYCPNVEKIIDPTHPFSPRFSITDQTPKGVDDDNKPVAVGNAYEQAKFIIGKIEKTLARAGASLSDIVRTRMFVTDISRWQEYGKAHGEFFKNIRPCTSMIEVKGLIAPEYMIEIEATAVIKD